MFRALKFRIYPTFKQKEVLDSHFSAYKYCYNLCLEYKKTLYKDYKKSITVYEMQKELLAIRNEYSWLSKCKAECIREAAQEVDNSFVHFFNGKGYPKFKSKKSGQTFFSFQSISCKQSKLKFYGLKINFKTSIGYNQLLNTNKIKKLTFNKDKCGQYWASALIELPDLPKEKSNNNTIGIDFGIKSLIVTSDGKNYENKKYFVNSQIKLSKLNRSFSRKKKGSKNRNKARLKVAKHYRKIKRQREWYYHQISNELIRDNQTIILETLNIRGMIKNRRLSKSIIDVSWSTLNKMLEYKAEWHSRTIIKIGAFEPSSKICSGCGNKKTNLSLSDRIYSCDCCGLSIDRDLNAAINIKQIGLKIPEFMPVEEVGYEADEAGSNSIIINN